MGEAAWRRLKVGGGREESDSRVGQPRPKSVSAARMRLELGVSVWSREPLAGLGNGWKCSWSRESLPLASSSLVPRYHERRGQCGCMWAVEAEVGRGRPRRRWTRELAVGTMGEATWRRLRVGGGKEESDSGVGRPRPKSVSVARMRLEPGVDGHGGLGRSQRPLFGTGSSGESRDAWRVGGGGRILGPLGWSAAFWSCVLRASSPIDLHLGPGTRVREKLGWPTLGARTGRSRQPEQPSVLGLEPRAGLLAGAEGKSRF